MLPSFTSVWPITYTHLSLPPSALRPSLNIAVRVPNHTLKELPTQRQTSVQQDLKTIFATQQLPYVSAKLPMDTLLKAINQLCEIETMPHDSDETGMTMEEKEAIERVKKECVLDPKLNRFVTSLLLKQPTNLANNYYRALAQAKMLHKKNLKNPCGAS